MRGKHRGAFSPGRQDDDGGGDDSSRWLGTYGDAITLLMAFFVMLYAMSEVDATKFEGLSEKLLTMHHQKNYAGAVKKLNLIRGKLQSADAESSGSYWSEFGTLKAGEAAARNSALLHELYFSNMIGGGNEVPPALGTALSSRFGSLDAAVKRMRGCAKATSGWVILAIDRTSRTIEIVQTAGHAGGAWHAEALIVLDVFEHSYAIDYGPDKDGYLDAFFKNLNWVEIGERFDAALARG